MYLNMEDYQTWFDHFTDSYRRSERGDVLPLNLKVEHTRAVLAHAQVLVREEKLPPDLGRAAVLAALFHDLGRFPQYQRWRTFRDTQSANHGFLGIKSLKEHGCLKGESPRVRALTLAAVAMHNRFALPQGISAELRLVTDVVRNADKLDIFRIMAGHLAGEAPYNEAVVLHVKDDADVWSPKVLDDALHGRVAAYADLTSINDLRILLGTWMYDLRFAATRRALAQSGLIPQLLAALPPAAPLQRVRQHLLEQLEVLCV